MKYNSEQTYSVKDALLLTKTKWEYWIPPDGIKILEKTTTFDMLRGCSLPMEHPYKNSNVWER